MCRSLFFFGATRSAEMPARGKADIRQSSLILDL